MRCRRTPVNSCKMQSTFWWRSNVWFEVVSVLTSIRFRNFEAKSELNIFFSSYFWDRSAQKKLNLNFFYQILGTFTFTLWGPLVIGSSLTEWSLLCTIITEGPVHTWILDKLSLFLAISFNFLWFDFYCKFYSYWEQVCHLEKMWDNKPLIQPINQYALEHFFQFP